MSLRGRLLAQQAGGAAASIPLTPMIDVVFLLIIFFLFGNMDLREQQLIAALAPQKVWPQHPAGTDAGSRAVPQATWLTIRRAADEAPEYRVDGGRWESDMGMVAAALSEALEAKQLWRWPGATGGASASDGLQYTGRKPVPYAVVVDAHAGVSLQIVIDAFALCESAGAREISLRTD